MQLGPSRLFFLAVLCWHAQAFTSAPWVRGGARPNQVVRSSWESMPTEVAQDILDVSAGVIGGSFGVMGTLVALEFKKMEVRERAQCPYCIGTGHLTCATCLGSGVVTCTREIVGENGMVTLSVTKQSCPDCNADGYITCVNCKGDGRLVPTMLDTSVSRDPESELDDIGMT